MIPMKIMLTLYILHVVTFVTDEQFAYGASQYAVTVLLISLLH